MKTEEIKTVSALEDIDRMKEIETVRVEIKGKTGTTDMLVTREEIEAVYAEDERAEMRKIEAMAIASTGDSDKVIALHCKQYSPAALRLVIRYAAAIRSVGGWQLGDWWGLGGEDAE